MNPATCRSLAFGLSRSFYASLILYCSAASAAESWDYRQSALANLDSLGAASVPIVLEMAFPDVTVSTLIDEQAALLAPALTKSFGVSEEKARVFAHWISESALMNRVPVDLLAGLIFVESTFRFDITSSVGAVGPAQIRPLIWDEVCPFNIFDRQHNIFCAGWILSHYHDRYQRWDKTLMAYNVGPSHARLRHYRTIRERYVSKVLNASARLRKNAPDMRFQLWQ